ncbi:MULTISPECIES: hypothetical protein [Alphaproteobacteria]|uniref:DUF3828 domain-containing protein n=2 Tax=Alphaproteobacteria TaxID=28211 RepID=A0A512HCJ4_9HYPH|nr:MULTISPECIES: hypothetical protein [Alphaproteobacteria]GEO83171.1 hypothetical protein RNA01_01030 [Ciceribacter naphthalenivorans]GLR20434.1 hypothetical protein GCM10007920_02180 [Ciceribacter naphthalenivorans]GLT03290.1 hypothetical protein GCM10007926_02180 [Sphingomonas psychrolutea]
MKRLVVVMAMWTLSAWSTALAADPADPVKALMAVADGVEGNSPASDYYDEVLLKSIYSKSFVQVYRMAALGDELLDLQGVMTGQDEVVVSQDPCEMKDLKIVTGPGRDGFIPVKVYFDISSCWGHKPNLREPSLWFHVVTEDDRYVIDNFWNSDYQNGRLETSVKARYADLVKTDIDMMLKGVDGLE